MEREIEWKFKLRLKVRLKATVNIEDRSKLRELALKKI